MATCDLMKKILKCQMQTAIRTMCMFVLIVTRIFRIERKLFLKMERILYQRW